MSQKTRWGAGEMAPWIKVLAIEPDGVSVISGTRMVEGDKQLPQGVLKDCGTPAYIYMQ